MKLEVLFTKQLMSSGFGKAKNWDFRSSNCVHKKIRKIPNDFLSPAVSQNLQVTF